MELIKSYLNAEREIKQEIAGLEQQVKTISQQILCLNKYYRELRKTREELERNSVKTTYCPPSDEIKRQKRNRQQSSETKRLANFWQSLTDSEKETLMKKLEGEDL